jgi:hypothetical protein
VAILREIALDRSMPGSTRVAACRVLLGVQDQDPAEDPGGDTRINARAGRLDAPCKLMTQIPTIATHRGVGIHDHQSPGRIRIVKAAIDRVAWMSDIRELADFAADSQQPPEARMFAANKVEVEYELAAEERRNRPTVDLDRVRATVAALDSLVWRDPWRYGSLLDHGGVEREQPLDDSE